MVADDVDVVVSDVVAAGVVDGVVDDVVDDVVDIDVVVLEPQSVGVMAITVRLSSRNRGRKCLYR